jgi:hypothetical protein
MAALDVLPRLLIGGRGRQGGGGRVGSGELPKAAEAALKAHGKLLLWDLGGIERNRPRWDVVRRLEGRSLWVNSGARDMGDVMDCLVAGAHRVVISTRCLRSPDLMEAVAQVVEGAVLCVDEEGPGAAVSGAFDALGHREVVRRAAKAGIGTVLLIARPGAPVGHRFPFVPSRMEVYAGPAGEREKGDLESLGVRGLVVDWGDGEWRS